MGANFAEGREREKNNVRDARMLCVLGFKILIMEWRRVCCCCSCFFRYIEREEHERDGRVFLGRYDSLRVVGISFSPKKPHPHITYSLLSPFLA